VEALSSTAYLYPKGKIMSTEATTGNDHIIELASKMAMNFFGSTGALQPFAVIETAGGNTMIVPAEDMQGAEGKQNYINILRYLSVEQDSVRIAIAAESWSIDTSDPEKLKILNEIYARGGSMSEHPDAIEVIFICAESDDDRTMRQYKINRNGIEIKLELINEKKGAGSVGLFTNFHIPTDKRDGPAVQLFVSQMKKLFSYEAKYIEVETDKSSKLN
jgi:hypothetical protein